MFEKRGQVTAFIVLGITIAAALGILMLVSNIESQEKIKVSSICGNQICEQGENIQSCLQDCLPSEWDWRNVNGTNWITELEDLRNVDWVCNHVALTGFMEANYNIQVRKKPKPDFDLSEYDYYTCARGGRSTNPDDYFEGMEYLKNVGAVEESCPQSCKKSDVEDCIRYKIESYESTYERKTMKKWLVTNGPLYVSFCLPWFGEEFKEEDGFMVGDCDVEDKYAPPGETYNCQYHAAVLVGYNDEKGHWIIKNFKDNPSGGPEPGFVRIKYGRCYVDGGPDPKGVGAAVTITFEPVVR